MTNKEARRILLDIADQMPSDECADWIDAISFGIKAIDAQPCEDCISREEMLLLQTEYAEKMSATTFWKMRDDIRKLPSVKPKYTDEEIDKAQAVEQAYVDKMVELAIEETKRPKGKWIKEEGCLLVYRCSNCKKFVYSRESESDEKFEDLSRLDSYKYCPRCGTYMGGGEDEG